MSIEHHQHDDAVDKVLAAMRDAVPPEGMEARIAQRLQQQAAAPRAASFRWRDAIADYARSGEWWRGAITGATAVLLMTATFSLAGHLLQTHPANTPTATNSTAGKSVVAAATLVGNTSYGAPASQKNAQPCVPQTLLRASGMVPSHTAGTLRTETRFGSEAPSHPAPPLPLTDQERALIRLAQTADPKQLATLNAEEHANLEAQDAAAFAKFFAPRTPLPATERDASANSPAAPQITPERNPEPDSAVTPKAEPVEELEIQ